jgi:hypothetical protein
MWGGGIWFLMLETIVFFIQTKFQISRAARLSELNKLGIGRHLFKAYTFPSQNKKQFGGETETFACKAVE